MKIKIPKVIRELHLADYAPEYGDTVIHVWVNPTEDDIRGFEKTRTELLALGDLLGKAKGEKVKEVSEKMVEVNARLNEWYAKVWSQADDQATHWTVEDVRELAENSLNYDPGLWRFVQEGTAVLINEYRRGGYQKKFKTTSST